MNRKKKESFWKFVLTVPEPKLWDLIRVLTTQEGFASKIRIDKLKMMAVVTIGESARNVSGEEECTTKNVASSRRKKLFCKNGHAMVESNLYRRPDGQRQCLSCKRSMQSGKGTKK